MTRLKNSFTMAAIIIAVHVMVACSLMFTKEERRMAAHCRSRFQRRCRKMAGTIRSNPRTRDDDWVTLVIGETGAYEFASYRMIGVFAGKGKLVLTDGKLSAESRKGRPNDAAAPCGLRKFPKVSLEP